MARPSGGVARAVVIGVEMGPTSASKRDPPGSIEYPFGEGVQGFLFLV